MLTEPAAEWESLRASMERWRLYPGQFVREAMGANPEPWQDQALIAVATHNRVAIRSGHGVGKTTWLAWLILWFMLTRFPTRVPCTAPTRGQLKDILWAELTAWHAKLKEPFKSLLEVSSERIVLKAAPRESFGVATTARRETPEAFQGRHSENMLFIGDESSGIDDNIFEVALGMLSTPGSKMVLTGNPTRLSGFFYDAFHKLREDFFTFRVSSADVPRATGHIKDIIARYGEESNAYRIRVLGNFPAAEDEAVIPLVLCEEAMTRKVEPMIRFRPVWGVDVARFGRDRTALAKRRANVQMEPIKFWREKDTMQVAGIVANEFYEAEDDDKPAEILVDVIGIGAGVVDRLHELGLPVRGINVGESNPLQERFRRLRDELWFRGREWLEKRDCKLCDEALIGELVIPTYSFASNGRIVVESKDDIRRRGLPSPDLADSWLLTFAGGLDRVEDKKRERYGRMKRLLPSWMAA